MRRAMPSDANPYGFTPTEYVSQDGHGSTMIKRTARGWKVCQWRTRGYETIAEDCESFADALAAYVDWMQRPADNDTEF